MSGDGPFLWLNEDAPPAGFRHLPPGGMCVSAFVFVLRGDSILLGKYADDPAWDELAGLDGTRRTIHGKGWTIPASQLKYGEDPREAGRRIVEDVLRIEGATFSEPRSEVDLYESHRFPGHLHYDMWFLMEATRPRDAPISKPAWYAELGWKDPRTLPASEYARGHQDVVARWLERRNPPGR